MSGQLDPSDLVGMSFWIISAAMVAATFFFWVERDRAAGKWKTSLTVAAMVTGIAAIHYFYMRGVWADTGESPLVFRYVDWLLTVPLQIGFPFKQKCLYIREYLQCAASFQHRAFSAQRGPFHRAASSMQGRPCRRLLLAFEMFLPFMDGGKMTI